MNMKKSTLEVRPGKIRRWSPGARANPAGPACRGEAKSKRLFDVATAVVLLVLLGPIIVLAGLAVKLTSRGPALYSQRRVGRNGRVFWIYKLRSMYHECERNSGPRWATTGDPRVTPVGYFLRRTHLDELPQLWNVIRGDMSLVGPRPERPEFVEILRGEIPHYPERLAVRPGVTGLAQLQLPPDSDLNSVRRKLAYDRHYLRHTGFWLDIKLMVLTAVNLVGIPLHVFTWILTLPIPSESDLESPEVQTLGSTGWEVDGAKGTGELGPQVVGSSLLYAR